MARIASRGLVIFLLFIAATIQPQYLQTYRSYFGCCVVYQVVEWRDRTYPLIGCPWTTGSLGGFPIPQPFSWPHDFDIRIIGKEFRPRTRFACNSIAIQLTSAPITMLQGTIALVCMTVHLMTPRDVFTFVFFWQH